MEENKEKREKIGLISLGCDKNRIDSEKILYSLKENGYEITPNPAKADVIIINTCAFIDKAKKESIDTILEFGEYKKTNERLKIVVVGCLAERYASQIKDDLPEVDVFAGLGTYKEIADIIAGKKGSLVMSENKDNDFMPGRVISTPAHYAYLKISDGCDNFCSYCAIPYIRGRYHSYNMLDILEETRKIYDSGVKELIIVAQDTTKYGVDFYGKPSLPKLLEELVKFDFYKIRIMYAYPEIIDDELIEMVSYNSKIAKYLDIPFQHVNDYILKKMNRHTNNSSIRNLIEKIKVSNENIAIRSSFIVGFPGEDELMFGELKKFIQDGNIDYAGFFEFSKEEGTLAYKFPDQISSVIKKKRQIELSKLQSKVICDKHQPYLNTTQKVIYEGVDYAKKLFYGRNEFNAPEIDTKIYFSSKSLVEIGNIYDVSIKQTGFNLTGEIVD